MNASREILQVSYFLTCLAGTSSLGNGKLLRLIDHAAGIAVDDAAQKLGCAVRTIWRDLEGLSSL